jgi:hypothetical protein
MEIMNYTALDLDYIINRNIYVLLLVSIRGAECLVGLCQESARDEIAENLRR